MLRSIFKILLTVFTTVFLAIVASLIQMSITHDYLQIVVIEQILMLIPLFLFINYFLGAIVLGPIVGLSFGLVSNTIKGILFETVNPSIICMYIFTATIMALCGVYPFKKNKIFFFMPIIMFIISIFIHYYTLYYNSFFMVLHFW